MSRWSNGGDGEDIGGIAYVCLVKGPLNRTTRDLTVIGTGTPCPWNSNDQSWL
jgi:hypothetical protein